MKTSTLFLALSLTTFPYLSAFAEEKETPTCCAEEEASAEAEAAGSIYQLDAKWTNQHGNTMQLSDLKGRPVLLTMGYASCQFACPRLVSDLLAIEAKLTENEKEQLAVVFVSIDPERDTPEKLAAFFKQYKIDPSRWSGLRGSDDAVLELSVAIGTRYRKLENNDFAHSNTLTLLSPTGEIVHQQEGLGTNPTATIASLRKLLENKSSAEAENAK